MILISTYNIKHNITLNGNFFLIVYSTKIIDDMIYFKTISSQREHNSKYTGDLLNLWGDKKQKSRIVYYDIYIMKCINYRYIYNEM